MSTDKADRIIPQLSRRDRLKGQRLFQRYITLNGISIAFLMNEFLILYGIKNGLTDPEIAVLASFMHLTMAFMPIGKRVIHRYGLSKSWAAAWFLRYLSGSVIVLAPLVGRFAPQWAVSGTILLGAFGFALFRSVGLMAESPLMGEITTSRDQGRFISGNWMRAQGANFFTMVIIIAIMRFYSQVWIYQVMIAIGCLNGFYCAALLRKVPETEAPRASARKPVLESLKISFSRKRYRRTLFAWAAGFSSFVLVLPFSTVIIKNGYGISDHTALMFSLLILLGGISAAVVNSGISDRVGPRPLLIIYICGFFIVSGYWALAPDNFQPAVAALIFFLAGFMKTGINAGISHYFLSVVETRDRVGISMFARMFGGAAAGIAGSVGSATIITLLQSSGLTGLPLYRGYFFIIFLILIPLTVLMLRLEPLKEWRIRSVLSLLFSMRDLKALYVMNRLEQSEGSEEEVEHVEQLQHIASSLGESTLRGMLESHRLPVRVHALRALRQIEFGEKTENAILQELRCGEFTTAWTAAEILGEHGVESSVPDLRRGLDSQDPFLVGKCMVALVELGDRESYPRIREIFRRSENPRIIIHGANAFIQMKDPARITDILEKMRAGGLFARVADELFSAIATLCGRERDFYHFLREYTLDPEQGIAGLGMEIEQLTGERMRDAGQIRELQPAFLIESAAPALRDEKWFGYLSDYVRQHDFETFEDELRLKFVGCLVIILNISTQKRAGADLPGD